MLTIFTAPKPFAGKVAAIQRNAIRSWTLLRPECEIVLMGDETGIADVAAELGVRHEAEVGRNEFGTPLASAAFASTAAIAANDLLCYVNADIVLLGDFMTAVATCFRSKRRAMLVGRRWEVLVEGALGFEPGWEEELRCYVRAHGRLREADAIDYFVFPRALLGEIPRFALGRPRWDNWLLYRARARGAALVDATAQVMAVHQNHDYGHHPQGWSGVWEGPEALRNEELLGGRERRFTIDDATHELIGKGVRWRGRRGLRRRFGRIGVLRPWAGWIVRMVLWLVDRTHSLRRMIGATATPRQRGGDE